MISLNFEIMAANCQKGSQINNFPHLLQTNFLLGLLMDISVEIFYCNNVLPYLFDCKPPLKVHRPKWQ